MYVGHICSGCSFSPTVMHGFANVILKKVCYCFCKTVDFPLWSAIVGLVISFFIASGIMFFIFKKSKLLYLKFK